MRIAVIDEDASRAAAVREGLASLDDCEIFVVIASCGLVARIGEVTPDVVLIDFSNPARDMLEEHFSVSRALARPITLFVDESTGTSIDAGLSIYAVAGLARERVRALRDLALLRLTAFAGGAL